jgi:hypothetical protein
MSNKSRLSEEVGIFLSAFSRLERLCNGVPTDLSNMSLSNAKALQLCTELYEVGDFLRSAELNTSQAFSFPSNPEFQKKWRLYESDYEAPVFQIVLSSAEAGQFVRVPTGRTGSEFQWAGANVTAHQASLNLHSLIVASEAFPQQIKQMFETLFPGEILEGNSPAEAWQALSESAGLNAIDALRRRSLLPFVLIPRQDGGDRQVERLLRNLENAQKSFVFGATVAALVLMRSIMEATIRDRYSAVGKDLVEQINSVEGRLPSGLTTTPLHRLRMLANKAVHLSADQNGQPKTPNKVWVERMLSALYSTDNEGSTQWLEREIIYLFAVLRKLIESMPVSSVSNAGS